VWGREELEEMGVAVQAAVEHGGGGFPGTVVELLQARERELPVPGARLLACGPPGMLKRVALWGLARGIPCQVSLEAPMACGVGVCLGCAVKRPGDRGYTRLCREGPVMDAADVDWECIGGL
jgi:dihydroorotate dehydrogenase electron transfer subunit